MALQDRWPLKRGSIHMEYSMTGQEKSDHLIQVTAWASFTVYCINSITTVQIGSRAVRAID